MGCNENGMDQRDLEIDAARRCARGDHVHNAR